MLSSHRLNVYYTRKIPLVYPRLMPHSSLSLSFFSTPTRCISAAVRCGTISICALGSCKGYTRIPRASLSFSRTVLSNCPVWPGFSTFDIIISIMRSIVRWFALLFFFSFISLFQCDSSNFDYYYYVVCLLCVIFF